LLIDWAAGVVLVYAVLFGMGELLLGSLASSLKFFAAAAVAAAIISADLARRGFHSLTQ
jgi:hypothetical protein